jgi:hypothetical protein
MYYKIVSIFNPDNLDCLNASNEGGFTSFAATTKDSSVEYSTSKKAYAPEVFGDAGYLLLLFKTKKFIVNFINECSHPSQLNNSIKIFSAMADEIKVNLPPMMHHNCIPTKWKSNGVKPKEWPEGTIMANGVILKKDVTNEIYKMCSKNKTY